MRDPFRPNSNAQLVREAQVGLSIVAILLALLIYVAYYRISNYGRELPDHVRSAPIAETVWPGAPPMAQATDQQSIAQQIASLDNQRKRISPANDWKNQAPIKDPFVSSIDSTPPTQRIDMASHSVDAEPTKPDSFKKNRPLKTANLFPPRSFQPKAIEASHSKTPTLNDSGENGSEFSEITRSNSKFKLSPMPRPSTNLRQPFRPNLPKQISHPVDDPFSTSDRVAAKSLNPSRVSLASERTADSKNRLGTKPQRFVPAPGEFQAKPITRRSTSELSDSESFVLPPLRSERPETSEQLNGLRPDTSQRLAGNGFQPLMTPTNEPIESKLSEIRPELQPLRNEPNRTETDDNTPNRSFTATALSTDSTATFNSGLVDRTQTFPKLQSGVNRLLEPPRLDNGFVNETVSKETFVAAGIETKPKIDKAPLALAEQTGELEPKTLANLIERDGRTQYTVQPKDDFWSIAQKCYGDPRFFRALHQYNKTMTDNSDSLEPGTTVNIPQKKDLLKLWPRLCPQDAIKDFNNENIVRMTSEADALSPNTSSSMEESDERLYETSPGDTLFEIARQRLGQASRYIEILEMNRNRLGQTVGHDMPLRGGIRLELPTD